MPSSDSNRQPLLILFLCIVVQAAVTLSYSITLHYELKTSGFDGAVYVQLMHNLLGGHGLTTGIVPPYVQQYWLGFHFSPVLYLIAPFYYLFPHIETLLALGSISVALAAWPIYLTAKTILENSSQALLVAVLYLINPFVVNGVVWDFHEVDFAPLIISWMLWAVVHKKRYVLLALGVALMGIKEHYGLSVAGFGLLWAWQWRDPKFGVGLAALGIAVLLLVFCLVIPHFNPAGRPTMMNAASTVDRFSWLTSLSTIKLQAIPIMTEAFWYGMKLLLPLLLLPLGAFSWLLPAIADASTDALSHESMMRSILSYHSMALVPVLLIATCQAIKRYCHGRIRFSSNDILLAILAGSACFSYLQLALPLSEPGNVWELSAPRFDLNDNDRKAVDEINALIPKDAVVAAQSNVLPHIHVRYEMYSYPFPYSSGTTQYVVLNLGFPFKHALSIHGTPFGDNNKYFKDVDSLLHDKGWGVIYYSNRWVVLQKGGTDNATAHQNSLEALEMLKNEFGEAREYLRHH